METKQAVPSAFACMESSFEMRLVAWGMLDELKNEVDTWMSLKKLEGYISHLADAFVRI